MRREPATERAGAAVARQYQEFCAARGHSVIFDSDTMNEFMNFYVDCGFAARSLGKRNSELRLFARRYGIKFPASDSPEWGIVCLHEKSLIKLDPSEEQHATVLHVGLIGLIRARLGVSTTQELWTCDVSVCQLVARMALCHCCMLRGCEHDDGMRVSDVAMITDKYITFKVNMRRSARKIKSRPARLCVLPVELPVGQALMVYMQRCHSNSAAEDVLFPARRVGGASARAPQTTASFMRVVKACAGRAQFTPGDLRWLRAHSFRAGGATEHYASGISEAFIMQQGGWTSDAVRRYNRPAAPHRWAMAQSVVAAMKRLRNITARQPGHMGWSAWRRHRRVGRGRC